MAFVSICQLNTLLILYLSSTISLPGDPLWEKHLLPITCPIDRGFSMKVLSGLKRWLFIWYSFIHRSNIPATSLAKPTQFCVDNGIHLLCFPFGYHAYAQLHFNQKNLVCNNSTAVESKMSVFVNMKWVNFQRLMRDIEITCKRVMCFFFFFLLLIGIFLIFYMEVCTIWLMEKMNWICQRMLIECNNSAYGIHKSACS